MKGNKSNNREHTHWLSVDSQAGSSPRSSWSCCTWNTWLILSGTTSLSGASAHCPGASELGSLQRRPWRKCFFLASCVFSHPCCWAQGEMLTLSGWGRKLLPGVQWEESSLLWLSSVIVHISKFEFIETKIFQTNNCKSWTDIKFLLQPVSKFLKDSAVMRLWHHSRAVKSVRFYTTGWPTEASY